MTAAIPQACCAGADDGEILAPPCRICRAHRGDLARVHSGANAPGLRAISFAIAVAKPFSKAIAFPDAVTKPDFDTVTNTNADTYTDANRREFQRGIDQ